MRLIKTNPNSAKGPDKGKIVNKLYCILLTTLKLTWLYFFRKKQTCVLMGILPTDIQILFTNYDIITYALNLASCSEHFISINHRILANPNFAKRPDKGNTVNKLYCILLTTLELTWLYFFRKKQTWSSLF
jgi:hypothetical protein